MNDDFTAYHYATWKGVPANELNDAARDEMIRHMAGIWPADHRPLVRFTDNEVVIPARRSGKTAALMEKIAADAKQRIDGHILDAIGYGGGGFATNTVKSDTFDGPLTLEKIDAMFADLKNMPSKIAAEREREQLQEIEGFGAF